MNIIILKLQILFLYGIIKENVCISIFNAFFGIVGITVVIVEANNHETNDPSIHLGLIGWTFLIWSIITTIIAFMFIIDLLRIRKQSSVHNQNKPKYNDQL